MSKGKKCGEEKLEREKKNCYMPLYAGQKIKVFTLHCDNEYTPYRSCIAKRTQPIV